MEGTESTMRNLPFVERNIRRTRVYSGRVVRFAANRGLQHNCCFYHIPKSGGTSLSEALHAVVPLNDHIGEVPANTTRRATAIFHSDHDDEIGFSDDGERCADVFALRERMQLAFMANNVALVHGHLIFSHKADRHFGHDYEYVTMLRDPVARIISNYRGATRDGYTDKPFDEYLSTYLGRSHATHNLRYFSGRPFVAPGDEEVAIKEAKAVIDKFAIIGFVDAMDDFISSFTRIFGPRLRVGRYNASRNPRPDISEASRKRLVDLCGPDIELHDYARSVMCQKGCLTS